MNYQYSVSDGIGATLVVPFFIGKIGGELG